MKIVSIDFETAYSSKDYSLSKMSTQDYITSDKFEVIGVGVQWAPGHEPVWCTGASIPRVMDQLRKEQDNIVLQAHNCQFDSAILSWHYGVRPAFLVDTLSLARTVGLQATVGGSLGKLAEQMQSAGIKVPPKGDEVIQADGKWLRDFSPEELARYGRYCLDDVRILDRLAQVLKPLVPIDELMWQSTVLKMYTEPLLRVNGEVVAAELQRVKDKREASKHRLAAALGVTDLNALVSVLNSNPKFAEALQLFGAETPMKTSPTTGKPTFALGIKDVEFMAMLEHPVGEVRELVVARMGLKSSIEESRCEQFLKLAEFEFMPAPYKISGARSHRLGSADGLGLQNLPSGRVKGQSKAMRESIEAPEGYVLVGADSSSVEVRCLAYIANATTTLDNFRIGICPYSALASQLFGGDPVQIKADAKKGIEPAAKHRQIAKALVLGAGYSLGHTKFVDYAKLTAGLTMDLAEAKTYIDGYRRSNAAVVQSWRLGEHVLSALVRGEQGHFGGPDGKMFFYDGQRTVLGQHIPGVRGPEGCWMSYPELEAVEGKYGPTYRFVEMQGRKRDVIYIYGGKLIQNLTQYFAFSVMKWYAAQLEHKIVLNSHDEHVLCVPIAQADAAAAELESLMKTAPPWAPGLPLDCEVHRGFNYGELK